MKKCKYLDDHDKCSLDKHQWCREEYKDSCKDYEEEE